MTKRTVLTTGGNGGIGLATALAVAEQGHRSFVTVRSDGAAEVVHEAARENRVSIDVLRLDVTDADECDNVIRLVRPDVLVNNAGYALFGAVETTAEEDARALFDTLLFSSVRLARLSLPHMRRRGWGRILFMSSLFGRVASPPLGWYAAAKHAIEGIADVMRMEVARDGIQVVVIEPGGVRSEMLDKAQEQAQEQAQGHAQQNARGLASDESRGRADDGPGRGARERSEDDGRENAYAESLRNAADLLERTDMFRADPALVGRAVVDAIEARTPKPRVLVGYDAQIIARLSPVVPTWLSDRVTRFVQGL